MCHPNFSSDTGCNRALTPHPHAVIEIIKWIAHVSWLTYQVFQAFPTNLFAINEASKNRQATLRGNASLFS
jgi:hypothetical protein